MKNSMLVNEFDTYVREHPEVTKNIPNDALVVMMHEDDHAFSNWSKKKALEIGEKNQPIVYVKIKKMRPIKSRIEEFAIEKYA